MIQPSHVLRTTDGEHVASSETSTESDSTAVCPLCGMSTGDQTQIYTHLQIGHKKSELAAVVLDR